MANPKGNPQNLKRPVKGGPSPNPHGRPPDALNAAMKKLTQAELEEIANLIIKGNLTKLKAIAKDETAPVIKVMVAAVAVKIVSKGDMDSLDKLLNRLLGKVKDNIHHSGIPAAAPSASVIVTLPSNGREANKK